MIDDLNDLNDLSEMIKSTRLMPIGLVQWPSTFAFVYTSKMSLMRPALPGQCLGGSTHLDFDGLRLCSLQAG